MNWKLSLSIIICLMLKNGEADWNSPFFIAVQEDILIEQLYYDYVSISMNEEIIAPFTLVYLKDYNGNNSPKISQFSEGQPEHLGLNFEKVGNRWDMVITKKQDYENKDNQVYTFEMEIESTLVTVKIVIRNIFDNPPTVSYENPCQVPELNDINYVSQCLYKVTDIDGMFNNSIKFEIQGNFDEQEIFDFKLNESYSEAYSQTFNLRLKKTLYYDERFFYSFRVTVYDAGNNPFSFNIIVEVEDVPNKPPMWTKVFASAQFPEKTYQEFEAKAIDGDTGINAPICYSIEFEDDKSYPNLISINRDTGKIFIQPIDRDSLKTEVFPFFIKAYECDDSNSSIINSAVILVEDINDNIPLIEFPDDKNIIKIDEETFYTLFQSNELNVEDIDLGRNAMYNVKLGPEKFAAAFNIIPENGYQFQEFSISVLNTKLLDFEVPEFQTFNITISATESYFEDHKSEKVFQVQLLNWNDELPKFEQDEYIFSVNETVGENYILGTVKANDRDIGDRIEYYLNDLIGQKIAINMSNGDLSTILNRTFDYEQQTEMTFQVFARDTLQTKNESTHVTSTQVYINVLDINDTPPTIILPRKFLSVTENELLAIITDEIEVYDPDTSADLILYIDWELSSASGLDVQEEDYLECVEILTEAHDKNRLKGTLMSSATRIIDYEKFQVLFLIITAVDKNTEVNENSTSAVLTVFVEDVNDNAPEFVGNTLEVKRSVIEESNSEIFIGFLNAIDRDGPGNNDITFSLIPHDSTTDQWVKINEKTGELSVGKNNAIDCDIPKRFEINYEVNITDGELSSAGNISITIIDINNKMPETSDFERVVEIYEDVTDYFITNVKAFDLDRDEPHNIVQYSINYQSNSELQRYFSINMTTGELRVKQLDEHNRLDRDTEPSEYIIPIYIEDNLGIGARNRIDTTVHVILLDVNDNSPQMPPSLDIVTVPINERVNKSTTIVEKFYAPDIDEGLNGQVLYEILSIEPIEIDREPSSSYENMFILENYEYLYARITTGIDLKGFSGKWSVKILAVDRGNETQFGESQSSEASYEIKIDPVNYNAPRIVFPNRDNMILRIDYGLADIGRQLMLLNGSRLASFDAFDDDAGIFGDVTFSIEPESNYFEFIKYGKLQSDLRIISPIEEKIYQISILAKDGGGLQSNLMSISLAFVDRASEPYFENNMWDTLFTENQTGLEESRTLPEAVDPKNFGIESNDLEFKIYYYIDDSYRPEDAKFFTLNSSSRVLSLKEMLDRESVDQHSIRIFATNEETMPQIRFVSEKAMLYITIMVEDVNDNPPSFIYSKYAVGISERDNLGKVLISLEATDPDLDDIITYSLLKDTMQVSNSDLDNLKDSAFIVNLNSGSLILNFQVQSSMSGYFEFQVEARDLVNHTDKADVRIFIIADASRVYFVFLNNVEDVKAANQNNLIKILSDAYNAECVIDDILPHQTSSGVVDENETDLRVHFIKDNEAIDAEEIKQRSSEIVFITELSSKLSMELSLTLKGLPSSENGDENDTNNNLILEITLAAISVVLFILLVVSVVLFINQKRNYNRQIKALSEKKFDDGPTKYNNVKALPNTNIYSGENNQFNPAMNNNFDTISNNDDTKSIISDDFGDLSKTHIFDINSKLGSSKSTYA